MRNQTNLSKLRHEHRRAKIGVGKAKHEKLVGIRDWWCISRLVHEVVVVGHPKRMKRLASSCDIAAERQTFDLRRNIEGGAEPVVDENLDNVQENGFRYSIGDCGRSIHSGYVNRSVQVNFKDLLHA